jgi:hypothetical protein
MVCGDGESGIALAMGRAVVMGDPDADMLSKMPDTFRFSEALKHINKGQFYNLLDDGRITLIARGLYRKNDWYGDEDLIEIASASPRATTALRSALARHNLIDDIPDMLDIALPRGNLGAAHQHTGQVASRRPRHVRHRAGNARHRRQPGNRHLLRASQHHRCLPSTTPRRCRPGERGAETVVAPGWVGHTSTSSVGRRTHDAIPRSSSSSTSSKGSSLVWQRVRRAKSLY